MFAIFFVCFQVIAEQYPKMLLILDDVWSHDVINAFSVRCRILVTTRVAALISPVLVKNVHSVSVSDGTYLRISGIHLVTITYVCVPSYDVIMPVKKHNTGVSCQ